MKKTYPTSKKYREWWKHMRSNKRGLNKSTRKIFKRECRNYNE